MKTKRVCVFTLLRTEELTMWYGLSYPNNNKKWIMDTAQCERTDLVLT